VRDGRITSGWNLEKYVVKMGGSVEVGEDQAPCWNLVLAALNLPVQLPESYLVRCSIEWNVNRTTEIMM
jgi:hypothetical protein